MINIVQPQAILETPIEVINTFMPLIERAGRTCYKSEDKINPESAEKFVKRIIRMGHESVIEHCVISYRIICSRACSHQLVRHRIAAYSQESQRYCDYGDKCLGIIIPPSIEADKEARETFLYYCDMIHWQYHRLQQAHIPPEDARFLLPNACKTEVFTTFNLRQWRHVLDERAFNPHAQWEIKGIMMSIAKELSELLPAVFPYFQEEVLS